MGSISHVHHGTPGQASCYRGTATSAKNGYHMVAVPSRSRKGVKVVTANLPESFANANVVCLL